MKKVSRQFLLGVAVAIVFAAVWQKISIWIRIDLSAWGALAFFGVMVLVLFLMLDHLFNRE